MGHFHNFCAKKLYFHCTRENNYGLRFEVNIFPRALEISFLHTKGCGNAISIILTKYPFIPGGICIYFAYYLFCRKSLNKIKEKSRREKMYISTLENLEAFYIKAFSFICKSEKC